jgi:Replication-relaxation
MDAMPDKQTRNSRWSRDPVIGRAGAPTAVYPTDRDLDIFKLLVRFRYLPADYIHAFVGGNEKALSHRLNLLSRKPNLYLARPPQQRQCADANYRPLIYELDDRGVRMLRERGLAVSPRSYRHNFAHDLMIAQITASIELGTRGNPAVRRIDWREIVERENAPAALRQAAIPSAVSVSYSFRGQARTEQVIADAQPFGLERIGDGGRSYLFFPGIEADCGTEPIDAGDPERSSIAKKFFAYLAVAEQGLQRSHFGFPNFFVPFITTSAARMCSMMELLDRITNGNGSKILLFKTFPSFTAAEKPPVPSGHMLTEPWQRVGHPPFRLDR